MWKFLSYQLTIAAIVTTITTSAKVWCVQAAVKEAKTLAR
jgi:hypothetical protein